MKQTAIEWLEMEIVKLETKYAILGKIYELCEQAKEMEKQQLIDAHGSKLISPKGLASEYWVNGEEYYNKTFNKGQ